MKTFNTDDVNLVSVNNRTTETQPYRVIIWDTSSGAKTAYFDDSDLVAANNTEVKSITIDGGDNVSRYEVEFRFVSPHVAPYLQEA